MPEATSVDWEGGGDAISSGPPPFERRRSSRHSTSTAAMGTSDAMQKEEEKQAAEKGNGQHEEREAMPDDDAEGQKAVDLAAAATMAGRSSVGEGPVPAAGRRLSKRSRPLWAIKADKTERERVTVRESIAEEDVADEQPEAEGTVEGTADSGVVRGKHIRESKATGLPRAKRHDTSAPESSAAVGANASQEEVQGGQTDACKGVPVPATAAAGPSSASRTSPSFPPPPPDRRKAKRTAAADGSMSVDALTAMFPAPPSSGAFRSAPSPSRNQ